MHVILRAQYIHAVRMKPIEEHNLPWDDHDLFYACEFKQERILNLERIGNAVKERKW